MDEAQANQSMSTEPVTPLPQKRKTPRVIGIIQFLMLIQAAYMTFSSLVAFTFNAADVAEIGISKSLIVTIASFQLLLVVGALVVVWAMNKRFAWAYYCTIIILILNVLLNYFSTGNRIQYMIAGLLLVLFIPQRSYFRAIQGK